MKSIDEITHALCQPEGSWDSVSALRQSNKTQWHSSSSCLIPKTCCSCSIQIHCVSIRSMCQIQTITIVLNHPAHTSLWVVMSLKTILRQRVGSSVMQKPLSNKVRGIATIARE